MIKKGIILICLILSCNSYAQVGIGTNTPVRTLHVEGNMRIRELDDKSQVSDYNKLLVVNANGDVNYIERSDLHPDTDEFTSDKQVLNNIYTTTNGKADDAKFVSCGKFDFAFKNNSVNGTDIRYKLVSTENKSATVYITLEQNWQDSPPTETNGGFEFQVPTTGKLIDNTTFENLPTSGQQIVNGELNVLYLLYPGDKDLYRLTFYRLDQSTTPLTYDFVTACEKF